MIINKIVYGPDGLISFNKRLISRGQTAFNKCFNKWSWGGLGRIFVRGMEET